VPAPSSSGSVLKLYQLLAKDDDVTPKSWLISARSEEAAFRFACRRFLPRELWLGTGVYAPYQEESGAPVPAAGLTPAQEESYLDGMSVEEFDLRLGASHLRSFEDNARDTYHWLGEAQPYRAEE
jgi:hypothetical protein